MSPNTLGVESVSNNISIPLVILFDTPCLFGLSPECHHVCCIIAMKYFSTVSMLQEGSQSYIITGCSAHMCHNSLNGTIGFYS
jgi:hypothetical protein